MFSGIFGVGYKEPQSFCNLILVSTVLCRKPVLAEVRPVNIGDNTLFR